MPPRRCWAIGSAGAASSWPAWCPAPGWKAPDVNQGQSESKMLATWGSREKTAVYTAKGPDSSSAVSRLQADARRNGCVPDERRGNSRSEVRKPAACKSHQIDLREVERVV